MLATSVALAALQTFADRVTAKMQALGSGEPEEQLRAPFENLLAELQRPLGWSIVTKGEAKVEKLGLIELVLVDTGLEPVAFRLANCRILPGNLHIYNYTRNWC